VQRNSVAKKILIRNIFFSTRKRRLIKESKAVSSIFTQVKIKQAATQKLNHKIQSIAKCKMA